MEQFTWVSGSAEKQTEKVGYSIQTAISTRGIGSMISNMVKVPISTCKVEPGMLEAGKTIRRMASEKSGSQTEHFTLASISTGSKMVKVFIAGLTDRHTRAIG